MQRILEQPVVDSFIDAFNAAGTFLEPSVKPVIGSILSLARDFVPSPTSTPSAPVSLLDDLLAYLSANASPHAARLPLMNPIHVVLIIIAYLVVVFGGMTVMKALPRLNVNLLAMVHNTAMVALSAYMMVGILNEAYQAKYTLWFNPIDTTETGFPMAKMIWLFYISKIFEFTDTKNNRQIPFLHVYHHTSVFGIWWLVTFIAPGSESYFSAALNSFIHVVMYGYYLLSSLGIKQVSFIKRYITAMQMTQFCCMMVQASFLLVYPDNYPKGTTPYPRAIASLLFWYMWTMLGLFANFFLKDKKRRVRLRR
ncbi:GNS1/SUR4 family-domain-containing protein [Chytridium lagenaria]|nr:GNS1/SUR4 family-domain-containing protein [Chytridium lagenaria]